MSSDPRRMQVVVALLDVCDRINARETLAQRLAKLREELGELQAELDIELAGTPPTRFLRAETIGELIDVHFVLQSVLLRPELHALAHTAVAATCRRVAQRLDAGDLDPVDV